MLTLERRLELLAEIQVWRAAQIAAGLPPVSPGQEEEDAEQQAPGADMEDAELEKEEEGEGEADPAPLATGFGMADALARFEITQAEEAAEQ